VRLGHKAPWCCTELLLFMPMSAVFPHRGLGDAADGRFPQVRQEHFEPVKVIGTRRPGPRMRFGSAHEVLSISLEPANQLRPSNQGDDYSSCVHSERVVSGDR